MINLLVQWWFQDWKIASTIPSQLQKKRLHSIIYLLAKRNLCDGWFFVRLSLGSIIPCIYPKQPRFFFIAHVSHRPFKATLKWCSVRSLSYPMDQNSFFWNPLKIRPPPIAPRNSPCSIGNPAGFGKSRVLIHTQVFTMSNLPKTNQHIPYRLVFWKMIFLSPSEICWFYWRVTYIFTGILLQAFHQRRRSRRLHLQVKALSNASPS